MRGKEGSWRDGNPADKLELTAERVAATDLRTRWIDTDETSSRFKTWRNVVLESTQETFSDGVVSRPAAALAICRKMIQNGGDRKRCLRNCLLGVRIEPGMKRTF